MPPYFFSRGGRYLLRYAVGERVKATLIKNEEFDGIESRLITLNEKKGNYNFSLMKFFFNVLESKSTIQYRIKRDYPNHKHVKRVYQTYGKLYQLGLQLENILKQETAHSSNAQNGMDKVSLKGFGYINFRKYPILVPQIQPDLGEPTTQKVKFSKLVFLN